MEKGRFIAGFKERFETSIYCFAYRQVKKFILLWNDATSRDLFTHPFKSPIERSKQRIYTYIYISISRRIEVAPHRVHSDLKRREV